MGAHERPAGEFTANIFEPGGKKISEKANSNKKQAETSGPRTDGGEHFRPWPFPPSPPPSPLIKQYHSLHKGISIFLDAAA